MSEQHVVNVRPISRIRAFLTIFVPVAGIIAGLLFFVYLVELRAETHITQQTERKFVDSLGKVTADGLNEIVLDVLFLADHKALKAYIQGNASSLLPLEYDYWAFSRHKRLYEQISYIDETGMEAVRVNFKKGNPVVAPPELLENMRKRSDFVKTAALDPGQIFISPSINIENGRIVRPSNPILRIGTPVFDNAGRNRGIVLVHFFAQKVIDLLELAYEGSGAVFLLNGDGHFIRDYNADDELTSRYPERIDAGFAEYEPAVWSYIRTTDRGSIRTQAGLFSFLNLRPVASLKADSNGSAVIVSRYHLYLISYVPSAILTAGSERVGSNLVWISAVLLILGALISWHIARIRKVHRDAQIALANTSERLARSNAQLEEFAYVASHDLQEPLRKIMLFGERLQSKYSVVLGNEGQRYISRMTDAADRMYNLIQDLLTYSRISTQEQPYTWVDLEKIAREVVGDLEARIEEHNGKVILESLPTIQAEAVQMRQLFQNLIGNALKFHKPDVSPIVTVRGRTLDDGNIIEIEVIDNGIGFEVKNAERIFDTFQRLHQKRGPKGNGIGLSVCRKIVDRHRGQIIATSEPGEGATFTIELPAYQGQECRKAA